MLVVVFTYNRPKMLSNLLKELDGLDVIIIDDGSDEVLDDDRVIRTHHEGKRGFWRKWVIARQLALGSKHNHFLFLPDDISNVNLSDIKSITNQGWDNNYFGVNIINCNRTECWGYYRTGQEDIQVGTTTLKEVGFVDCGFLTNRATMELVEIQQVPDEWFDREDISSGVGYNLTNSMRLINAKMMMPFPALCSYDWEHDSVMHPKPNKI